MHAIDAIVLPLTVPVFTIEQATDVEHEGLAIVHQGDPTTPDDDTFHINLHVTAQGKAATRTGSAEDIAAGVLQEAIDKLYRDVYPTLVAKIKAAGIAE